MLFARVVKPIEIITRDDDVIFSSYKSYNTIYINIIWSPRRRGGDDDGGGGKNSALTERDQYNNIL